MIPVQKDGTLVGKKQKTQRVYRPKGTVVAEEEQVPPLALVCVLIVQHHYWRLLSKAMIGVRIPIRR
jgi:hypothetical protein